MRVGVLDSEFSMPLSSFSLSFRPLMSVLSVLMCATMARTRCHKIRACEWLNWWIVVVLVASGASSRLLGNKVVSHNLKCKYLRSINVSIWLN